MILLASFPFSGNIFPVFRPLDSANPVLPAVDARGRGRYFPPGASRAALTSSARVPGRTRPAS